jgi:hypothetical protein
MTERLLFQIVLKMEAFCHITLIGSLLYTRAVTVNTRLVAFLQYSHQLQVLVSALCVI